MFRITVLKNSFIFNLQQWFVVVLLMIWFNTIFYGLKQCSGLIDDYKICTPTITTLFAVRKINLRYIKFNFRQLFCHETENVILFMFITFSCIFLLLLIYPLPSSSTICHYPQGCLQAVPMLVFSDFLNFQSNSILGSQKWRIIKHNFIL